MRQRAERTEVAPFQQKRMLAHLKPDESRPEGRPSEYRPEYCDLVREKMGEGLSLTAFAGFVGVAKETAYRWMSRHREFGDAVSRARAAQNLWWELKMKSARKGAEVTASIFALRNINPDDWKDVRQVEHQHTHQLAQLTDAQLNAIAAGHVDVIDDDVIDGTCERVDAATP